MVAYRVCAVCKCSVEADKPETVIYADNRYEDYWPMILSDVRVFHFLCSKACTELFHISPILYEDNYSTQEARVNWLLR